MMFPNPNPPRDTLEGYSLVLRKAADEAAPQVLQPECVHASLSRGVRLARGKLRPCWRCWYSWYCRLQAGVVPHGCRWRVVDHQVTGETQRLGP
jgi:hypothetical protein